MKNIVNIIVLSFIICSSVRVYATHMAGADLTYVSLGNGSYQVNYTFYRDCIGIAAQTSIPLTISSASCGVNLSATLLPLPGTGQLITFNCPSALTTCNGGSAPGIQKWEYTATITLPSQCSDWTFGAQACCRNAAITTVQGADQYDMYLEAHLNNSITDNNSPFFSNVPVLFECIGQDNYYNHGGLDVDGDSIVYSFINPADAPNSLVPYDNAAGYSLSHPLTSVPPLSINPVTGDIFMHPTQPEITIIAVMIEEYRNGILIGTVIRDLQIYTIPCSNQLPVASGINGTNVFNYSACIGDSICFDIFSSDPNNPDSLTIFWNQGIQGASFTFDSTLQHPVGHFCWFPTMADLRPQPYTFVVTVRDNYCPTNGVQSFAYSIQLHNLQAVITSTDVFCFGGHNGTAAAAPAGTGPFTYVWWPSGLTTSSINHLAAGNYMVDIMDQAGCLGTYNVLINEPPPLIVNVTGQNTTCAGAQTSATAASSGGTGTIDYLWSTSPPQNTNTITNLAAGVYTVTVTDDNFCTSTGTVTITGSTSFTASISSTPATCLSQDGSAAVTVSGGSGNFSYSWQPNVSTGPSASNLAAGVYSVLVTDISSGCSQTLTTIVNNSAGVNAVIFSSNDATCQSGEDGSAAVVGSGGTPPYTYLWTPGGDTTSTVNNLSPGTYSVMVADYNGCPAYGAVTIGYQFPSPQLEIGPDTTMCIGDSLVLDAGTGFTYLWSDNSTNHALTVTGPGLYSVLITDSNGCESFDAINVNYITCFHIPTGRNNYWSTITAPNPVIVGTHVTLMHVKKSTVVFRVINAFGIILSEFKTEADGNYSTYIDLSAYDAGIYYLEIDVNGEKQCKRIIKM